MGETCNIVKERKKISKKKKLVIITIAIVAIAIPAIALAKSKTQTKAPVKIVTNIKKPIEPITTVVEPIQPAPIKALPMSEEQALAWIISHEGGPTSVNPSSLACGLAQSLPCSKVLTYAGVNLSLYNLNTYEGVKAAISTVPVETQRAWMIQYCINRYGSVVGAQQAWLRQGWY